MTMWFRTHGYPAIRFGDENADSSPISAQLMSDGRLRIVSDPDAGTMRSAWLNRSQVREFALELLGLAELGAALGLGDDDCEDCQTTGGCRCNLDNR